ncbi:hypothetical protein LTR12_011464 [Friedmanniomyces endolithicus]|nr:hypothetical protein LTR12_011464 [Friedmanniomyces endolithicus]
MYNTPSEERIFCQHSVLRTSEEELEMMPELEQAAAHEVEKIGKCSAFIGARVVDGAVTLVYAQFDLDDEEDADMEIEDDSGDEDEDDSELEDDPGDEDEAESELESDSELEDGGGFHLNEEFRVAEDQPHQEVDDPQQPIQGGLNQSHDGRGVQESAAAGSFDGAVPVSREFRDFLRWRLGLTEDNPSASEDT